MQLKNALLCLSAVFIVSNTFAQDQIYKRNGEVIEGKVTEVGTRTISYKKTDNPDGPNYVIDKMMVDKVEYENGTTENMGDDMHKQAMDMMNKLSLANSHYPNNIISLSPLQIMDRGIGIMVSYERV